GGMVAGFGYAHREFVAYPFVALLALDCWYGALSSRRGAKDLAIRLSVAALVLGGISLLNPHADIMGPGTAGPPSAGALPETARLCWRPEELRGNVSWLLGHNLPVLFSCRSERLADFNLRSALATGHPWTLVPLCLPIALATLMGFRSSRGRDLEPRGESG